MRPGTGRATADRCRVRDDATLGRKERGVKGQGRVGAASGRVRPSALCQHTTASKFCRGAVASRLASAVLGTHVLWDVAAMHKRHHDAHPISVSFTRKGGPCCRPHYPRGESCLLSAAHDVVIALQGIQLQRRPHMRVVDHLALAVAESADLFEFALKFAVQAIGKEETHMCDAV